MHKIYTQPLTIKNILISIICLLAFISSCRNEIDYLKITLNPTCQIDKFEDKSNNLSINDILKMEESDDKWKKSINNILKVGLTNSTIWLRIHIENKSGKKKDQYITLFGVMIHKAEFYTLKNNKVINIQKAGIKIPFTEYSIKNTYPTFHVELNSRENNYYFVKLNPCYLTFPIHVMDESDYIRFCNRISTLIIIFIVFAILLILYNIFLFFSFRDKIHLYYILYILFIGIALWAVFGNAYSVLWPESPELQHKLPVFSRAIAVMAAVQFVRLFNNLKKILPSIDKILIIQMMILAVIALFSLFSIHHFFVSLLNIVTLVVITFSIVSTVYAFNKGHKPALYFLAAWGIQAVFIFLNLLFYLGVLEYDFLVVYGMILLLPLDFFLFSFSLYKHIEVMREQNRNSEKDIIELRKKLKSFAVDEKKLNAYVKSRIEGLDVEQVLTKLEVLMTIENVYHYEDLSLEWLSDMLSVSSYQLSEILNKILRTNFNSYINKFRISEAQNLIKDNPDKNLLEIAFQVGFNSKSSFNRWFKKITEKSPTEYRKNYRE